VETEVRKVRTAKTKERTRREGVEKKIKKKE